MDVQSGQVIAHRFRLVRELGRGGVGSVWLAHQLALDVPCALKFFVGTDADLSQHAKRFEIEAKTAARLHHPNVVRVLDSGIWLGRPFIAMELLEGECLDARLRRSRLSAIETIALCHQVGAALTKAHALGIVHRDLKPSNIFLAREDDLLVVKLIDFGIAQATAFADPNALTRSETIIGTPAYMSPEQIEAIRELDGRSDLWSLGVIVFECLTGTLPFSAPTLGELFSKIMYKPIPVPSRVAPGLGSAFDAWWARASARDPATRFRSAAELCDKLAQALGYGAGADVAAAEWSMPRTSMPPVGTPVPPPAVGRSFNPTLGGHARQSELAPSRSRALLAGAIAMVALAGIAGAAWMLRAPPPVALSRAGVLSPAPDDTALGSAHQGAESGPSPWASERPPADTSSAVPAIPPTASELPTPAAPTQTVSAAASSASNAAPLLSATVRAQSPPTFRAKPKGSGMARGQSEWGF